ncbi:Na+:H+ dicarboxylate symporter [Bifidobacterium sp. ESL0790]|uniref:Na+:H+ dicarboxylate symporter n=1 Tax=Bifidobacterium sp. ESL0790 TaxID=2983233 RepID=UPI0023F8DC1F|nr:Na+:H+ dicarboxylate symporter [Bifidobacterium sp. ESL0790]WEV71994.1 Na+:H+ dicarboxylate symporter [Bifidobacterium sp. ESL0790]
MSIVLGLEDFLVAHPSIDVVISVLILITWIICGKPIPDISKTGSNLFVALSTLSGLVMAAATFICTMTYQSESRHMRIVRKRYSGELSRNWISVIIWTFIAAVLPLISVVIWETHLVIAVAFSLFALAMLVIKFVRCLHWLKYTLFMQKVSTIIQEPFTEDDMRPLVKNENR